MSFRKKEGELSPVHSVPQERTEELIRASGVVEQPVREVEQVSNEVRRARIAARYEANMIDINPERVQDGVPETFCIAGAPQKDFATRNYHTGEEVAAAVDAIIILGLDDKAPRFTCLARQAEDLLAEAQERWRHSNKSREVIAQELFQ